MHSIIMVSKKHLPMPQPKAILESGVWGEDCGTVAGSSGSVSRPCRTERTQKYKSVSKLAF